MINIENLVEYINKKGKIFSTEEVQKLISNQNREEIEIIQASRYKYEIWDKKTSINNINAQEIIKSRKYEINQVYLIYIDDKLVYLQDHNPEKEGYVKMTKTEAKKIAQNFISQKIEIDVDNIIVSLVLQEIFKEGNDI